MRKNVLYSVLLVVFVTALVGCGPADQGEGGDDFTSWRDTAKFNIHEENPQRVVHTSWAEQGVDARTAMGYVTADGTPFFDNIVQLYGLRLSVMNCSAITDGSRRYCNISHGLHICMPMDIIYERNFANYETVVAPVRARGHKWLLNIIPGSVAVGLLYRWPMEEWYPWNDITGDTRYQMDDEAVERVIDQLVQMWHDFPYDGLAYDEEYSDGFRTGIVNGQSVSLSGYPGTIYPGANSATANRIGGENLIRFAHEMNVAIFGPDYDKWSPDHEGMSSVARNRLIIESYEIRYGAQIPQSFTYPAGHNSKYMGHGGTIYRDDIFDATYNSSYGGWAPVSGNAGMPRNRYGPASIDLGFNANVPKPAPGWDYGGGIIPRMESHLQGNFGVVMYYHITSRAYTMNRHGPNYFGDGPLEVYLSEIATILHDTTVRFVARNDY